MYDLISTITDLPKLVGCHDFPTDPKGMKLIKMISDFINDEYKYNGKQVTEAFKMAVKRELYLDGKRVDPSTFGQHLSVNVVGQVLTAYKEHLRGVRVKAVYNPNQLPAYDSKPITPQDAHEMILKWVKEEGELPMNAPYKLAYKHLLSLGNVKDVSGEQPTTRRTRFLNKPTESIISPERREAEQWYIKNAMK